MPGLRNISKLSKGVYGEFVAEEFFAKKSYQLMARSLRTPYGEIDRLFRSPNHEYIILEVKSVGRWGEVPAIHSQQQQRLQRTLEYLSTQLEAPVELMYAVISQNQITLYEEGDLIL